MKTRQQILKEIQDRDSLEMTKVTYGIGSEPGKFERDEYPSDKKLLFDIAQSLRILIDWTIGKYESEYAPGEEPF